MKPNYFFLTFSMFRKTLLRKTSVLFGFNLFRRAAIDYKVDINKIFLTQLSSIFYLLHFLRVGHKNLHRSVSCYMSCRLLRGYLRG